MTTRSCTPPFPTVIISDSSRNLLIAGDGYQADKEGNHHRSQYDGISDLESRIREKPSYPPDEIVVDTANQTSEKGQLLKNETDIDVEVLMRQRLNFSRRHPFMERARNSQSAFTISEPLYSNWDCL